MAEAGILPRKAGTVFLGLRLSFFLEKTARYGKDFASGEGGGVGEESRGPAPAAPGRAAIVRAAPVRNHRR